MASREFCAFDSSGTLLAVLAGDRRLRLWDAATGALRQQYDEGKGIARRYTAMAWHRPRAAGKKRASSGQPKPATLGFVALGTDEGTITVWDLQRGVVARVLGEGMGLTEITALAFSSPPSAAHASDPSPIPNPAPTLTLYSASSGEAEVLEWDPFSGALLRRLKALKIGATSLSAHPNGKNLAVAGGSGARILDLASGKRVRKLRGGQRGGTVLASAFSRCGRYFSLISAESRTVELFDVAVGTSEAPFASIALKDQPISIEMCAAGNGNAGKMNESEGVLTALVTCEAGGVTVLRLRTDGSGKATGRAEQCTILAAPNSPASLEALAARLGATPLPTDVAVAHGSALRPTFDLSVSVAEQNGSLKAAAAVASQAKAVAQGKLSKKATDTAPQAEHITAPGELGARGGAVTDAANSEFLALADEAADALEEENAEQLMPLGERIEALAKVLDEEEERQRSSENAQKKRRRSALPTVESVVTVLQQAVQSADDRLLESCLGLTDAAIVDSTVDKLPSALVLPFLNTVVAKFEKRPGRATALSVWIRAVLTRHTGYLMSVPDLANRLSKLCQILDFRLASFPKFLDLSGRLELVLAHVAPAAANANANANVANAANSAKAARQGGRAAGGGSEPASVYRESEDEGSSDEDSEAGDEASEKKEQINNRGGKMTGRVGRAAPAEADGVSDDVDGSEGEEEEGVGSAYE